MGFNAVLLCTVVGLSSDICQVLACNPDFLSRSELFDALCCVPLRLFRISIIWLISLVCQRRVHVD
ncbi:hypothetical protein O6H91_01G152500 [Diphasiastrum complanatum]|uniref:Uncharacterized protein n=2 Tax=Diphasiastrum complanatum TaxID=34168 RepID=A0ACC2EXJ4_DIPCM|nr:hypothetical protein O6H91_01G151600 [Diphasiastrum complanatum]KAJ7571164.1 hypothetical protein O6H91_01G152500 [Diphasiastrum complanatum]